MNFPRWFQHTKPPSSDCLLVRHDDEQSNCIVITKDGRERAPNADEWPLGLSLLMVGMGNAVERTPSEVNRIMQETRTPL